MRNKEAEREGSFKRLAPRKINYLHYFGGAALILVILQLLTGLYMIFYYEPALRDTYKTVQYFNNETILGALTRNLHRYGAFFLVIAAFIHMARGYFRKSYQGGRRLNWLTGVALFALMLAFTVTGSILPWEWKGYWVMEMFNNWLRNIPFVGDEVYEFFMTSYTPTRNFVIHDILLPVTALILLEYHCISRLRKRGAWDYLLRHLVLVLPVLIIITVMALVWPVPSEDPEIIPLPMDGMYIPAPEWFFVTFLIPYWYFPPREWPLYLFWMPVILFTVLVILPFAIRKKKKEVLAAMPPWRRIATSLTYTIAGALVVFFLSAGLIKGSVESPWMGCNSCHNVSMGDRMGIPPVTYKDTVRNPLLLDNRWMMRHWYQPQVVW